MKKSILVLILFCFALVCEAQVINIPDAIFKDKLLQASDLNMIALDINQNSITIDANNDGEIQIAEALTVYFLNIQCDECLTTNNIQDLTGVNSFSNLRSLMVVNTGITNLSLNNLTHLIDLTCNYNPLSIVELVGMNSLETIDFRDNSIVSVNFNQVPLIRTILCDNNNFTEVHLNNLLNLEQVYFGFNDITSFTITNCPQLFLLWCNNNQISELEVNSLTALNSLYCQYNLLTSIDVTQLTSLNEFFFSGNNLLTQIFMKNGRNQVIDSSIGLSNLNFVCADDSEMSSIETIFNSNSYTNCNINSYCSFVPGGEHFVIQGNSKIDNDSNGCDGFDNTLSNLQFQITDGTNNGNFITNNTGSYSIQVQEGTHNITPTIENPEYFNISPSGFQVSFPTQISPINQIFCIEPNGVHHDLEVTIIPLSPARPGFDATYNIVYKNKGNLIQSGSLTLSFEDAKMDLVSSTPVFATQGIGLLSWDYSSLQPLETREIELKFNINSPIQTPAVNIGDQLNFTAIINPMSGDEYLLDNTNSLKQIVVGSFDPNDKTCVEGNTVGQDMIGQYVHYVIRFENTGTFAAENIVVKDMIDLTKFDLGSLIPISSSHSFVTRIANNGKVEFIFENIQLPFEDASNDGYIAFKIKIKPSLVVGDTFTNNASIYFDYNFPIITNIASTTIQVLGNQDFEFSNYFNLFPNPASDVLNIQTKNTIELNALSVYNTLGQLVLVISEVSQIDAIDVSNLRTGSYFIKLMTDKGITGSKFFKK
jgi:hypothetical protein